eukprot:3104491-Amphidinium_carterae.1
MNKGCAGLWLWSDFGNFLIGCKCMFTCLRHATKHPVSRRSSGHDRRQAEPMRVLYSVAP